jgi:hypothetical protein
MAKVAPNHRSVAKTDNLKQVTCVILFVMEAPKRFAVNTSGETSQRVYASGNLGRILLRREVGEIVEKFGSVAKTSPSDSSIEIVPPIPADRLHELEELLKELVKTIDPDGSPAIVDFTGDRKPPDN